MPLASISGVCIICHFKNWPDNLSGSYSTPHTNTSHMYWCSVD